MWGRAMPLGPVFLTPGPDARLAGECVFHMDEKTRAMQAAAPRLPGGMEQLRRFRYAPQPARFSPVQWLTAQLVACGLSDKEIAFLIGISPATVKAHNNRNLQNLGLLRRGQLVRYIFESGQFDPEAAEQLIAERRRPSAHACRGEGCRDASSAEE